MTASGTPGRPFRVEGGPPIKLRHDDPPITLAEAQAVDADDTTLCRLHRGQLTHLNEDGKDYFCPVGQMYWRYTIGRANI